MTFSFTGLPPSHPIGVWLEAMAQKLLQLLEDRVAQSTWLADEEFTAADLLSVFGVTTMRRSGRLGWRSIRRFWRG